MKTLQKAKNFVSDNSLKVAAVTTAALVTTPAFADINVDAVVTKIDALDTPINKIGAALLGIAVVILGWRIVRSVIR